MSDTNIDLKDYVRDVPDFPKPTIVFRDISDLLETRAAMDEVSRRFVERVKNEKPDYVAALESRGFLFAEIIAKPLGIGTVMVRKAGKLPPPVIQQEYSLEYRDKDVLEIQKGKIRPGSRVIIVDDVLATGGTAKAAVDLIKKAGSEVTSVAVLIELNYLNGRDYINSPEAVAARGGQKVKVHSLLQYD